MGTTLDSHSAIGMDLCNPKGIGACAKLKLVRIRGAEQHTIVDSVIMKDTRTICETSAFIDNLLSFQTDCFHVRDNRDVEQHVAMERKAAGRIFQGAMNGSASGIRSGLQSSIHGKCSIVRILWWFIVGDHTKSVANSQM